MLSPKIQTEILSMYFGEKKKIRAIARQLGVNRKSVERIIERKAVKLGIEGSIRASILDTYKNPLLALLQEDPKISAVVLMQRIRNLGYTGGYTILRNWVKSQRTQLVSLHEGFLKLDFAVGEAAQVDWGELGDLLGDGVKIHCFVMVLCYSRLIYVELTRREKFEDFIRCHENAFKYFDGRVPQSIWIDNLRTAVTERVGKLVGFNARFFAYMGHHQIKPHACNPARGNEKGRVEDGVKYVKMNFIPGRKWKDFADLTSQGAQWRDDIANLREHRATRKVPRLLFEHEEKLQLRLANTTSYETDEVITEKVRKDYHFIYETNQYSVPWTLVSSVITVRINATELTFYYRDNFITKHERSYLKHQKPFTHPEHEAGLKEIKPQSKNTPLHAQIALLESYGKSVQDYLKCLQHSHRSLKHEISRLMILATVYGEKPLIEAIDLLMKRGSIGSDQIELALQQKYSKSPHLIRPVPLSLQEDRLLKIPSKVDLRQYDHLILESRKKGGESLSRANHSKDSQENLFHEPPIDSPH